MNQVLRPLADRPLLLLDIDGVISLFGFDPLAPPDGQLRLVDGIPHYLSTHAAALVVELADSFEIVWCSGWEDRADEHLPSALGVPGGLEHLVFDPSPAGRRGPQAAAVADAETAARHWKLDAIDAFAGSDRPLAWVDDAFDDSCHRWARQRVGPTLLVATDPAVGLTAEHAAKLRDWAHGVLAG